ncbi:MAG: ABC-F family ATP-binding cassette domain-containing protein [Spirochaetales bacterium]|nr:ABC-F family ATP-binding cassette domain-containing protein [Spirochaetales bacterium]
MTSHIQLLHVFHSFGAQEVLGDISLSIRQGQKTALCGGNGSGKTTLMKIIAGIISADSGEMIKSAGCEIAYLPQTAVVSTDTTLHDEAEKSFLPLKNLVEMSEQLEVMISSLKEGDPQLAELLNRHAGYTEKIERSGYFFREKKINMILRGLGFSEQDHSRLCSSFSLGWQMRIALAKVLLVEPDILLLDEPTNFLDLEARMWLLDFIVRTTSGVLLVSHDRYFNDHAVDSVFELFQGKGKFYKGNYSAYEKQREIELGVLIEQYKKTEERREQLNSFINRFRAQASKASLVQSRVKELEKLPKIEIPHGMKKIHFSFPEAPPSGKKVLMIENLSHEYDGLPVFSDISMDLMRGNRIVVVGVNGAGKSTFLRLLAKKETPTDGSVVYGEKVIPGYYCQDEMTITGSKKTVFEEMEQITPTELYPKLRSMLGNFLFQGDDIFKPVSVLSGGEHSRLQLLKLLIQPGNLLILDEPTNHLDMASKEVLLDALQHYDGTLVFVSHDRAFIEPLAGQVLEIKDNRARLFTGNYGYYAGRIEQEQEQVSSAQKSSGKTQTARTSNDHEAARQRKTRLRRIEREEAELLSEIDRLSAERETLMHELSLPEVYADGGKVKELTGKVTWNTECEKKLLEKWEHLEEERMSF